MSVLDTQPGSISDAQRRRLFGIGRRRRWSTDELRAAVGGSISKLSRADASAAIERLSGEGLPNPPGQAPREKRRPTPGNVRMITPQNIEQIVRMMDEHFDGDTRRMYHWLAKNFKVNRVRDLATAELAGEVIYVLKEMKGRHESSPQGAKA